MSEYRIRSTEEIVTEEILRSVHFPTLMLPGFLDKEALDHLEVDQVFIAPEPETEDGFTAVRNGVEQDAQGNWVYAYKIVPIDNQPTN